MTRLSQARVLVGPYSARVKEAFKVIRGSDLSQAAALALIDKCFADLAAEAESGFAPRTGNPAWEISEQRRMATEELDSLQSQLDAGKLDTETAAWAANYLRGRQGVDLDGIAEPVMHHLAMGLVRARMEQQRLFQFRLDELHLPYTPQDPLFSRSTVAASVSPQPATPALGLTLAELVADYLKAKQRDWTAKTHRSNQNKLQFLVEHLGPNSRVSAITPEDIKGYRDAVRRLRLKHHVGEGKSFISRQTDDETKRINPKTANLIVETTKALFQWGVGERGLATNPAKGVPLPLPKGKKGHKPRRPFTASELEKIFSAPTFTGRKSAKRRLEAGAVVVQDAYSWIPVLAYYGGLRLGEIVQLHQADIHLDGPVPYIDVNEADSGEVGSGLEKHVKSEAGIRKVPLHPDIMTLGFKAWVEARRKHHKAKQRVFFEVGFGADGQASSLFSKWFGRFLGSIGLDDRTLVFHSFRHGMEDIFRNAMVPQYLIDSVIGHSDGKTSDLYGEGVSLAVAYEALKGLPFPVNVPNVISQGNPGSDVA